MKKQGFTILEILVVLAVLAILIAMAVPRIKGMQDQANISKVKSELKTLQTALESHYINKGTYMSPSGVGSITKDLLLVTDIPQIIPGAMADPLAPAGTDYSYMVSPDGTNYVIFSVGLDGTATITGIGDDDALTGALGDDICVSNTTACD